MPYLHLADNHILIFIFTMSHKVQPVYSLASKGNALSFVLLTSLTTSYACVALEYIYHIRHCTTIYLPVHTSLILNRSTLYLIGAPSILKNQPSLLILSYSVTVNVLYSSASSKLCLLLLKQLSASLWVGICRKANLLIFRHLTCLCGVDTVVAE